MLERNKLVTGSGVIEDSRRPKQEEAQKSGNYGLFLGGGPAPRPGMERSKTADVRTLGDQGVSIGSNDSGGLRQPAFARENTQPRDRSVPFNSFKSRGTELPGAP